jgi:hypothetical protein
MKWSTLIEAKREELEAAIANQYSAAINGNTSLNFAVILHEDGEVSESTRTQNSWSMAEHNNEATCVYTVQGFALEFDEWELLRNDNETSQLVVAKYNELEIDEEDHVESFKEIDNLHGFLQDNFSEWLEENEECIKDEEIANLDTSEIIDRKIEEEKSCELYKDE